MIYYCVQVQVNTATLDAQFFKQLLAFGMHAQEGYACVHTDKNVETLRVQRTLARKKVNFLAVVMLIVRLCLVSLVNHFTLQLPKRNFGNTVKVLKFPYQIVCVS